MKQPKSRDKVKKETFRIPWESSKILTELVARIRLDTGVRVTKTDIIAELLDLLRRARINTKKVEKVEDVILQVIEFAGRSK